MKDELRNEELDQVVGGRYFINNKNILYLESMPGKAYPLKGETARYQAQAIMDGLIGKYTTTAAYDSACLEALQNAGLV